MKQKLEWQNGEFTISTDRARLQIEVIHKFLSEESYWARERTLEQTARAIENSLPFGVYKNESLIGFARVVTEIRDVRVSRRRVYFGRISRKRFEQMADGSHYESSGFARFPALDFSDGGRARAL